MLSLGPSEQSQGCREVFHELLGLRDALLIPMYDSKCIPVLRAEFHLESTRGLSVGLGYPGAGGFFKSSPLRAP